MKVAEAVALTDQVRRNSRRIKTWQRRATAVAHNTKAGNVARAQALAAMPLLSQLLHRNRHCLFSLAHCPKARASMASFLKPACRQQIEDSVVDDRAYKELILVGNNNWLLAQSNVLQGAQMARLVGMELVELRKMVVKAERLAKAATA